MLTGRQQEIWKFLDSTTSTSTATRRRCARSARRSGSPRRRRCTRTCANLERARSAQARSDEAAGARAVGREPRGRRRPGERRCTSLPLVGEIAAGGPLLAEQNVEDYLAVPEPLARGGEEFLLRVKGDSMIDAGILDGDLVVVQRAAGRATTATSSSRSPATTSRPTRRR